MPSATILYRTYYRHPVIGAIKNGRLGRGNDTSRLIPTDPDWLFT